MKWYKTALLTACAVLGSTAAHAITLEVPLTGTTASVPLKGRKAGEVVTVYGISTGNESVPVKVAVFAPAGSTVTAQGAKVGKSAAVTLNTPRVFYPVTLRAPEEFNAYHKQCLEFAEHIPEDDFNPDDIKGTWNELCDLYSAKDLDDIGKALKGVYGGSWDRRRVCGYLVYTYKGGAGDGEIVEKAARLPVPQATNYGGLLQKNACGAASDKYMIKVDVKLPSIIPTSGFLRVRITEGKHRGDKRASIKPESDGKYKPQPLFLFSSLGACGQRMQVTKWAGDKPQSMQEVNLSDLLSYRDMTLVRTPATRHLSGGKGSVELFNRNNGYAVCFDLTKTRQRANGYPS